jgi:hypothetical protein
VRQVTDKLETLRQSLIIAQAKEGTMPSIARNCSTYIALTLAAATAVISTPGQAEATYQKLQWLLLMAAPEAAAVAGAIGERSDTFVSP